jgi:hypothetical protein
MSKQYISTNNLFSSAPGWRCFHCTIIDDQPVFREQPVLGWGVIEKGYPVESTELDLLVAIQTASGRPVVHCADNLLSWDNAFDFSSFIFLFNSELSEEDKHYLEQRARHRMVSRKDACCMNILVSR